MGVIQMGWTERASGIEKAAVTCVRCRRGTWDARASVEVCTVAEQSGPLPSGPEINPGE